MHLRMVFVSPDIATVRIVVKISSIHSTKISVNFGLKLNGSVRSNRKNFEKIGPPLEAVFSDELVSSKWTVSFDPILNPSTSLFSIFHVQNGGKHLSLQLLWIVNSRSIGVTCTSMRSYKRSIAASQAKCMFWLLRSV